MARRESSKYSGTCDTGFAFEPSFRRILGFKIPASHEVGSEINSIKTISYEFRNGHGVRQSGKSHLMRKLMAKISAYGVN